MYHCVPRIISGDSQISGLSFTARSAITTIGKEQIGRKGGEELDDRLDAMCDPRPQPDPDADRHPDDRGKRDQHHHADQGQKAQEHDMPDLGDADFGMDEFADAVERRRASRNRNTYPEPRLTQLPAGDRARCRCRQARPRHGCGAQPARERPADVERADAQQNDLRALHHDQEPGRIDARPRPAPRT